MSRSSLKPLLALLAGLLLFGGRLPVAAAGAVQDSLLFRQGNAAFRKATNSMAHDPKMAAELFRKALLRYRKLAEEGIDNGKLYYDIGNTYFRLGNLGKAILNYRRAERFIPNDENLRQNLDYALTRRLDKIAPKTEHLLFKTLFFWHYDLSTRVRSLLFAFFYLSFWLAATLFLWKRKKGLRLLTASTLFCAFLFLASLLVGNFAARRKQEGVITAAQVMARKGDSESYQPSFKEPLHAGTEFNLVENREQWLYIELADGRRCWIPANTAELVVPAPVKG